MSKKGKQQAAGLGVCLRFSDLLLPSRRALLGELSFSSHLLFAPRKASAEAQRRWSHQEHWERIASLKVSQAPVRGWGGRRAAEAERGVGRWSPRSNSSS